MKDNNSIRINILISIVVFVGVAFIAELFNLQVVNGAEYREQSENRLVREVKITAPRGDIYDRYGKVIATSKTSYSVNLYYTKIEKTELNKGLLRLANILEKNGDSYNNNFPIDFETMTFKKSEEAAKAWKKVNKIDENATVEEVIEFYKQKYEIENEDIIEIQKIMVMRYEIASKGYSSFKSVTLAKDISETSMLEIEEQIVNLPGVAIITTPERKYVAENIASHIIGYVGKISSSELEKRKSTGYTQNDMIGKSGIESSLEEFLRGTDGVARIEMDSKGRVTSKEETAESSMGASVVLTIDLDLQTKAEEVLEKYVKEIQAKGYKDAKAGSLVVVDVDTSEVLALASYPNYNPQEFTNGISNSEYQKYFLDESKPMFNRAIQGTYSPGSTFKMITAIAAIESGVIGVFEEILANGVHEQGHRPACWIWNDYRQTHGYVNAQKALQVSCNYFFYEMGYRMGIDTLAKYARMFGLGEKTGIELLGEATGLVASRDYLNKLNERDGKNRQWMIADTLSASIGQSYNSFTPLQMAYYIATLANGGIKNDLTILKSVILSNGEEVPTEVVDSIVDAKIGKTESKAADLGISAETKQVVFEGMRSVTGESGGTAYSVFKSFPIEVAGKTGTATASTGEAHAWFVGFAPYHDPQIAVVCVIEHGGHGSYTAPPVKEVMAEYFGYNTEDITEDLKIRSLDEFLVND